MSTQPLIDFPPFLCNSKLMQNYSLETPVSATGQLAVTQDRDGAIAIFALSSSNNVFCYTPDSTSDTGWIQTSTRLNASQIAVGLTGQKTMLVVTPVENSGDDQQIAYVEQRDDGTWGLPQQQTVENLSGMICHLSLKNIDGQLYLIIFTSSDFDPPYNCYFCVWAPSPVLQGAIAIPFLVDSFNVDIGKDAADNILAYVALTPQLF